MSLIALQRDFAAWLRTGDDADMDRVGAGHAAGLRVYQNNYRAQLAACLETGFPRTRQWIGAAAFHHAVVTHVDRVPPSAWTLDAYGRDFPGTLSLLHPDDAEVAELAWLELALEDAFVAPDHDLFDAASIADIDWDRAVLHLSPTIDIGERATNATLIWSALSDGRTPPAAERCDDRGATLVWRAEGVSCFRAIDALECDALVLARSGAAFPAICAHVVAARGEGDGVRIAGEQLGQWIRDGLVVRVVQGG
ncbi:MAG: putative DNA-binding domain-containing protein [Sphingobium sp.]